MGRISVRVRVRVRVRGNEKGVGGSECKACTCACAWWPISGCGVHVNQEAYVVSNTPLS